MIGLPALLDFKNLQAYATTDAYTVNSIVACLKGVVTCPSHRAEICPCNKVNPTVCSVEMCWWNVLICHGV